MSVALGPLARTVTSLEETVRHLDKRVVRLEDRLPLGDDNRLHVFAPDAWIRKKAHHC